MEQLQLGDEVPVRSLCEGLIIFAFFEFFDNFGTGFVSTCDICRQHAHQTLSDRLLVIGIVQFSEKFVLHQQLRVVLNCLDSVPHFAQHDVDLTVVDSRLEAARPFTVHAKRVQQVAVSVSRD